MRDNLPILTNKLGNSMSKEFDMPLLFVKCFPLDLKLDLQFTYEIRKLLYETDSR